MSHDAKTQTITLTGEPAAVHICQVTDNQPIGANENAVIYFGSIDGNAAIYVNGKKLRDHLLGSAPTYTGWNKPFVSDIPASYLTEDENVVSVQVTSKSLDTASGMTGVVAIIGKVAAK